MKVGIIKERRPGELRVAITPDTVKKYMAMGLSIFIESKAGLTAAITDQSYKDAGANIVKTSREALEKADIVLKVQKPIIPEKQGNGGLDEVALMKDGAVLICLMEPHQSQELIEALANKNITAFSMELLPRITRAQTMDTLSSQSNLAGYKAVLLGAAQVLRVLPESRDSATSALAGLCSDDCSDAEVHELVAVPSAHLVAVPETRQPPRIYIL